jgi:hypothetical protein
LYTTQRTELRKALKLPCQRCLTTDPILHTKAGTKALATMISATKITTTEWVHLRLSCNAAERNIADAVTLTRGWGSLQDQADKHTNQIE